jgi:hypothetical protein
MTTASNELLLSDEHKRMIKQVVGEMNSTPAFDITLLAGNGSENLLAAVEQEYGKPITHKSALMLRYPKGTVSWIHMLTTGRGISSLSIYADDLFRGDTFFQEEIEPYTPPGILKTF